MERSRKPVDLRGRAVMSCRHSGQHGEAAAGRVGRELGSVLALDGGYARRELTGVVDPHFIFQQIGAFGKMGDEDVGRGVAVLA